MAFYLGFTKKSIMEKKFSENLISWVFWKIMDTWLEWLVLIGYYVCSLM